MQEKIQRNQEMFVLWKNGWTYRQLASKYQISPSAVFRIVKRWKNNLVENYPIDNTVNKS